MTPRLIGWEQRSGEWGLFNGNLAIDHDGLIVLDAAVAPGEVWAEVECMLLSVAATVSLVLWESDDETDEGGVEFELDGGGEDRGRIEIVSRTGGTPTEVGHAITSGFVSPGEWFKLRICLTVFDDAGDVLKVAVETDGFEASQQRFVSPVSATRLGIRVAGLGAGSGAPSMGKAQFRQFELRHQYDADDHPTCEACACIGCSGDMPEELQVEITDALTGTGDCVGLVAETYVLDRLTACAWYYESEEDESGGVTIVSVFFDSAPGGEWRLNVHYIYSTGAFPAIAKYTKLYGGGAKPDCSAWSAYSVGPVDTLCLKTPPTMTSWAELTAL